jgi:hypothetical protein
LQASARRRHGRLFVKTTRNGWIDATKRLKKLERRVGGGGRDIGLGAPVVRLH